MKVLEPYTNDPNCLTSKRMEIDRRLKGMQTLVAGSIAPNIDLETEPGKMFDLAKYKPSTPYTLLIFWSADCGHCVETVNALFPWSQLTENKTKIAVVAISLDETETEIKAWQQKTTTLNGWEHLRAKEGVRSKVASDYFVLATPVMILLDSKTKKIVSLPDTLAQIEALIQ